MPKPYVVVEFRETQTGQIKCKTIGLNELITVGDVARAVGSAEWVMNSWRGITDVSVKEVIWNGERYSVEEIGADQAQP